MKFKSIICFILSFLLIGILSANLSIEGSVARTVGEIVVINHSTDFFNKVVTPNTIYEIRGDIDLGGESVSIPQNSVLHFCGGTIINGILIGNNTYIENNLNKAIFFNVQIPHVPFQFSNDVMYADWFFGEGDSESVQYAIDFAYRNGNIVSFLSRKYCFNQTVEVQSPQLFLQGTATGGEYGSFGTTIIASDVFNSSIKGKPLFLFKGGADGRFKGRLSGRISGINFNTGRKHDAIQFLLSSGPSRPFYINHCGFFRCDSAIRILDNGESTALGFLYIENCSMIGNKWNVIAHGRHSMMGLYFCKNIAEQCDGNINLGYTEEFSLKPFDSFLPKPLDYAASANITICDNLLEGTVDCIYINGGKCVVTIERNYFESSRKQFVALSFSNSKSKVIFDNNYIAHDKDVDLYLTNCNYSIQLLPDDRYHLKSSRQIR